jgi:hypothetical protein
LIIEAISFKLALDFFTYLEKCGLRTSNIKIQFWDRLRYEFVTYQNIAEMSLFFSNNYRNIDNCILGELCSIQFFEATSTLYDFTTTYKAVDVTGQYKLITGTSFDLERNNQRSIYTTTQTNFINQSVSEYLRFLNEIKGIYVTGIYSPCYAEPGWSENTSYLKKLREGLLNPTTEFTTNSQIFNNPSQQASNTVNYYDVYKQNAIKRLTGEILIINNRIAFIEDIISGNLNINTTPLNDIITYLSTNEYDLINGNYDYLLNMPIYTLNAQTLSDFQQLKIDKETELAML